MAEPEVRFEIGIIDLRGFDCGPMEKGEWFATKILRESEDEMQFPRDHEKLSLATLSFWTLDSGRSDWVKAKIGTIWSIWIVERTWNRFKTNSSEIS